MIADYTLTENIIPDSLREIVEVIGQPGAIKLIEKCGGTRMFIPKRLGAQHKLANLLGFEQAKRLSHHFGGETISIARGSSLLRRQRNLQIIRAYDNGTPASQLALRYQLTERQIYSILSQTVDD